MKNYELRITNYEWLYARFLCVFSLIIISGFSIFAQSHDQNFPTPIKANEISGRIPARDLGDARLTTFYYTFDGVQGDVFINVVTTNFNGDIDVFTADNLRPLTKITAYADSSNNETGRVVYLRQPLKLILRIEGRTPNDDAATFQIKFAGSFAASTAIAETSTEPEVKSTTNSDVRVNSVGTIIEVKPKLTPIPKEIIAKVEKPPKEKKPKAGEKEIVEEKTEEKPEDKPNTETVEAETEPKAETAKKAPKPKKEKTPKNQPRKPDAIIKQPSEAKAENAEKVETETKIETAKTDEPEAEKETAENAAEKTSEKEKAAAEKKNKEKKKSNAPQPVPAAALANINLIILFKDGTKIERPMSEILKFGVDKGILTVISKDGAIGRYSILDVEKMTVQ